MGGSQGCPNFRPNFCFLLFQGSWDGPNFLFEEIDKYWDRFAEINKNWD